MQQYSQPHDTHRLAIDDLRADIQEKSILLSSLLSSLPRRDPAAQPIKNMLTELATAKKSTDPQALRMLKRESLIFYRTLLIESAARAVSLNWQSPSGMYAVHDEAGKESGKIILTMNDYKRDYHRDGIPYEQAFRRAYIDGLVTLGVHVYLVSSGMAGLTTILAFLQGEGLLQGKVVMGDNTYFQGKGLILEAVRERAIQVSETDTETIRNLITIKRPTAVFLDSLSNSATMAAPDLITILNHLAKTVSHDMALVVDNTGLSIGFQPMRTILGRNRHIRLVVYESLNKFHEFGCDRVTAGLIWAYGPGTEKLFGYRKNCGTNISDLSAHALPPPNRKLLEKRLNRMNRNARFLADQLKDAADGSYSGGCLVAVRFGSAKQTIRKSQMVLRRAMSLARKQQIPLVAGTSFGFDTTRIYLTASTTAYGQPFLRIAAGTEDWNLMQRLTVLLKHAIKHA